MGLALAFEQVFLSLSKLGILQEIHSLETEANI